MNTLPVVGSIVRVKQQLLLDVCKNISPDIAVVIDISYIGINEFKFTSPYDRQCYINFGVPHKLFFGKAIGSINCEYLELVNDFSLEDNHIVMYAEDDGRIYAG